MFPANRLGYANGTLSAYQLKIMQELITISVFVVFATFFLKENLKWNYVLSFGFIILAAYFAFKK